MAMYSESEVSKIIDECFSLGQGGWNCEDDKEEYKEMMAQFCNELKGEKGCKKELTDYIAGSEHKIL